jgi:hypothetical protein
MTSCIPVRGTDLGDFIDPTIENPFVRAITWEIDLYISGEEWDKVLEAKWRRLVSIQES